MTPTDTSQRLWPPPSKPAEVELVLASIDSLPTLPAVATRLLERTTDARSSAREVIELIESDQSLSARILSMVRRANLGATANTVERAVVLLGFEAVRSLALSVQIVETFSRRVESASTRFDRVGFWKHSLAAGCAARLLAETLARKGGGARPPAPNPEEAFVCGLLHDIGKVVLEACFPKSYERVIERVESLRNCIADVEREVFGVDHTLAGRRLAVHWKLPEMIRESIWLHHQSPASRPTRIACPGHVQLVHVADRLVRDLRIGYSGNHASEESLSAVWSAMGLSAEDMDRVKTALPELIEARAELIGLEHLTSQAVFQEALADANAELARLNASLTRANLQLEQRSRCFEALRELTARLAEEPTLEDVCRAAGDTVGIVAAGCPAVVSAFSASRSIIAIAGPGGKGERARLEVLPASAAGDFFGPSELGGGWLPASTLPKTLVDHLATALGSPPSWHWPIRHERRLVGAVVTAGDRPINVDESMAALADALGAWLGGVESQAAAQQVNEELAETNRRLAGSQYELARLRSLAMVGEMAAGAAHELNNPLAVISGRAQMLARDAPAGEVRRSALLIADHAQRASEIVADLMDFAKPSPPKPTVLELAQLLGEIRQTWIAEKALTEEQFRLELSDDLPQLHADASQIHRLFDEVIRNAVEAMSSVDGPLLIINCRVDLADDTLVIRIQDNGCGMASDVLERAMTPFFSHRPAGRGRGLGLSRAARYAEINGGHIRLSSAVGEGTIVFVTLPVAANR